MGVLVKVLLRYLLKQVRDSSRTLLDTVYGGGRHLTQISVAVCEIERVSGGGAVEIREITVLTSRSASGGAKREGQVGGGHPGPNHKFRTKGGGVKVKVTKRVASFTPSRREPRPLLSPRATPEIDLSVNQISAVQKP